MTMHVPSRARLTDHPILGTSEADGNNGAFLLDSPEPGWRLYLIVSDGAGWEHVSVHADNGSRMRTPTWREMSFVKATCWDAEDVIVQFHPRKSEYVNQHPFTLHLWRPIEAVLPTPPPILVGTRTAAEFRTARAITKVVTR
jgi:hypothetical protein